MQEAVLAPLPAPTAPSIGHYDAIIVSTSPICLMTALALQTRGSRVLLVDRSAEVGGAWITAEIGGFSNVEVGCHLIDPDPRVYGLLRGLGIPMEPLRPAPLLYSRGPRLFPKRLPYSQRWLRDLYNLFARRGLSTLYQEPTHSAKEDLKSAARVARHMLRAAKGDTRTTLYPPGGCAEITARLTELVEAAGVEVRTATEATAVEMDREAGIVRLKLNGSPVTCGKLYVTASVSLDGIAAAAGEVPLEKKDHLFQNLYLVLRDCGPLRFTYTLFYEDRLVHRVSDLTRFAVAKPGFEGATILGLTVDEHRAEDQQTALDCFERLKEYRFISPDARMLDYSFLPYPFTWLEVGRRGWLKQELAPLVKVIDSEHMTHSIKSLLASEDLAPMLAFAAAHPRKRDRSERSAVA